MGGIIDALSTFLSFLRSVIEFPFWLLSNLFDWVDVIFEIMEYLPEPLGPIAYLGATLIVIMGILKFV